MNGLDLEALVVDFGLRRFRNYLIGAPDTITVITDHKPLCPIFNGNRSGSFRTERIKLRHQEIRFSVQFQPGRDNQADTLSRNAKDISKLPLHEQNEAEDLNNLLYVLHSTPLMDRISIASIANATSEDETLNQLRTIILKGQTWIPNTAAQSLQRYRSILPEITVTANGILCKGDRLILPSSLQSLAMKLCHQGSHPGQSAMQRRLRTHFFFHDMNKQVQEFVSKCHECQLFTDTKRTAPIQSHKVPQKCWEQVSVDLFGPMPSSKHIVVVQDMASRFPAAKLVSSTKANQVIPAISEIYDNYGNPENQLSDNGPPFNSKEMETFASNRQINLQKSPPGHPESNPVETFMKPLGKAMKIAHFNKASVKDVLTQLLENYRSTPHPATGISPASMLFRDGLRTSFPRKNVDPEAVTAARTHDETTKKAREIQINSSKYRRPLKIDIGDSVVLRDFQKSSKFKPIFSPEPCSVLEYSNHNTVTVERKSDGKVLTRHTDDVKKFFGSLETTMEEQNALEHSEAEILRAWHETFKVDSW